MPAIERPKSARRLVLRRKPLQSIWIGDDVLITVLDIERGRVKLSIEAPASVHIARDEISDHGHKSDESAKAG